MNVRYDRLAAFITGLLCASAEVRVDEAYKLFPCVWPEYWEFREFVWGISARLKDSDLGLDEATAYWVRYIGT